MRRKGIKRGRGNFAQRQPSGATLSPFSAILHSTVKQAGSQTNAAGVLRSNGPAAAYRKAAPISLGVQEEYLQNTTIIHWLLLLDSRWRQLKSRGCTLTAGLSCFHVWNDCKQEVTGEWFFFFTSFSPRLQKGKKNFLAERKRKTAFGPRWCRQDWQRVPTETAPPLNHFNTEERCAFIFLLRLHTT